MARSHTRTELKMAAQSVLLHGIGNVLSHWRENPPRIMDNASPRELDEFGAILKREADRLARLFGHEEAWTN